MLCIYLASILYIIVEKCLLLISQKRNFKINSLQNSQIDCFSEELFQTKSIEVPAFLGAIKLGLIERLKCLSGIDVLLFIQL